MLVPEVVMDDVGHLGASPTEGCADLPGSPAEGVRMKYMIMTFGEAATMLETQDPDWIREMMSVPA